MGCVSRDEWCVRKPVPRPVSPEDLGSLRGVLKRSGALRELMAERARDRKSARMRASSPWQNGFAD